MGVKRQGSPSPSFPNDQGHDLRPIFDITELDIFKILKLFLGFTGGSEVKNIYLQCRRSVFNPWVGQIPWRRKNSLEKEMATHLSILAWDISWTEEPGGLHSPWGRKRLGHDLATKQQQKFFLPLNADDDIC